MLYNYFVLFLHKLYHQPHGYKTVEDRNNNNNDNSNNQVNTNIANSANDQTVMGGAGMGRDVRLLERIWASLTGQEEEEEEEDTTEAGAESAANRKLAKERGMELMRDLLRERQMEDHKKSQDTTNSGYPPGLFIVYISLVSICDFFLLQKY